MPNLYNVKSIAKPDVYKQTARAVGLPITLDEAKQQLYIPVGVTTWDDEITAYINSGMLYFEKFTRQVLIEATFIGYFNTFPVSLSLKKSPLQSIESVKYFDVDNVEQTVNAANYYTTVADYYSDLIFVDDFTIPTTFGRPQIFKVEFKVGLATDDTDTPKDIKQGMKMYVAYMYENRGSCDDTKIPPVVNELFYPYKILKIVKNDIQ